MLGFPDDLMNFQGFIHCQKKAQTFFNFYFFTPLKMSPALTAKYQTFISEMSKQNNANATEGISLDPEVFNEDIEDPVDFIIALSNEFENEDLTSEQLRYIADTTNEAYGTAYTEDAVETIIDDFIEAITAE